MKCFSVILCILYCVLLAFKKLCDIVAYDTKESLDILSTLLQSYIYDKRIRLYRSTFTILAFNYILVSYTLVTY